MYQVSKSHCACVLKTSTKTYQGVYLELMNYSQSCSVVRDPPLSLQMRDWTGLESRMSASTESSWTRGESPMNDTVSGGTTAETVESSTKGHITIKYINYIKIIVLLW